MLAGNVVFSILFTRRSAYSCDPQIDKWAKSHDSEISKMERKHWIAMEEDIQYKMATYAAFSPNQKFSFWKEKLSEVLKLNWSSDEHEHIASLLEYIEVHKDIFDPKKFDEDSFDKFIYLWIEKGKTQFRWNSNVIYAIAASGETMTDTKGTLLITHKTNNYTIQRVKTRSESGSASECDCNVSDDWCSTRTSNLPSGSPTVMADCKNSSCEGTSGCGTLFLKSCDGKCVYEYL